MKILVPTLFGLEGLTADELRFLGMDQVKAENGRVCFEGDLEEVVRANIYLRMGERVLLGLSEFNAFSFEELFEGVKAIPWELWLDKKDAFPVKGWSLNSVLHSVPDCQKIIKKAVVTRLSEHYHQEWFEESGPKVQIQFSIMKDHVDIMLDSSGAGLYKRGYRANANAAPLRETLAAGMVDLAHVRSDSVVVDPMCGSGTLLIEAAMKARRIAPGLMRRFAAEAWSCFPEEMFDEERKRARALVRPKSEAAFEGYGFDLDPASVRLTEENARKAGVGSLIHAAQRDVRELVLPAEKQIVLCNPPYGERMLEKKEAEELYKVLGKRLPVRSGNSYFIITSDEEFESFFGRKADKKRKLYNGMIRCDLYLYYK